MTGEKPREVKISLDIKALDERFPGKGNFPFDRQIEQIKGILEIDGYHVSTPEHYRGIPRYFLIRTTERTANKTEADIIRDFQKRAGHFSLQEY